MKRIGESHFFLANLLNFILEGHNLIVYSVVVPSVGVFGYLLQGLDICDELSLESKGLAGFYFCELVEMGQGCELPSESQSGLGEELFLFVSHCGSIIIGLSLFLQTLLQSSYKGSFNPEIASRTLANLKPGEAGVERGVRQWFDGEFGDVLFGLSYRVDESYYQILKQQGIQMLMKRVLAGRFWLSTNKHKVVLFPGNGIGPEISYAVENIFNALNVPVEFEQHMIHNKGVTEFGDLIDNSSLEAVKKYKYGLKGPFETPIGKGYRSINVTLRKRLNLFANVRPCKSIEGVKTPYEGVDLVTIRENTEGEYSGLEHEVVPGVVENLKIISKKACENIAKFAFEYAKANDRKGVVACHKAGVMKMGDGLFIKTAAEIAGQYPQIEYWEEQIDTVCMQLADNPRHFDVMVMPNLYGDIVSDLCAGLIGGLGLTGSGNIGFDCEVYEAVHGTAPDIANMNKANPTAIILSSTMMLKSMKLNAYANAIDNALFKVYQQGKWLTGDIGGKATTTEFTQAIIDSLVM